MNPVGDSVEHLRGAVDEFSLRRHLPLREHSAKPILRYDYSLSKPLQLFTPSNITRHEGYSQKVASTGSSNKLSAQQNAATQIGGGSRQQNKGRHVRLGSGPMSRMKKVDDPYIRPVSAKEVIQDAKKKSQRRSQAQTISSGGASFLAGKQHESDLTRAASLQLNSFLRPQSGSREGVNSKPTKKAGRSEADIRADLRDKGSHHSSNTTNMKGEPHGSYKGILKTMPHLDHSAKAALQQAFALASTTGASHTAMNSLPLSRTNSGNGRSVTELPSRGAKSTVVRNPNYSPSKPYHICDNATGNNGGDGDHLAGSRAVSAGSWNQSDSLLMSRKQLLTTHQVPIAHGVPNFDGAIPLSKIQSSSISSFMTATGAMNKLSGTEESGLPLQSLTANSLLHTRMGMMRKMPVTNTLTGTLYYKKSFKEAGKPVEQKHKPAVVEQRCVGDGAPARQARSAVEEKVVAADVREESEEEENSTPSGERQPGDGEASVEEADEDIGSVEGLDEEDANDEADDGDETDLTESSSPESQGSSSPVGAMSSSSCVSSIHQFHGRFSEHPDDVGRSVPRPANQSIVLPALCASLFSGVPPTINFILEGEKVEVLPWEIRKLLKWKMSPITPNIVKSALIRTNFRVTKKNYDWLGCFGKHMKANGFRSLREYQKLNHFPGSFQLGRKDRLWRNLSKLQVTFGKKEFGFFPHTYVLPQDLKLLKRAWEDSSSRQKWIIKPPASARGIGIKVINRWAQVPRKRPVIVQKYISRPLLINDSKFDLRIYVYVTTYDPLRAYVFEDGLARFASCKYSSSMKNLHNKFMHLTNYSINKRNSDYQNNADDSMCQGHKWSLKALWNYLKKQGVSTQALWDSIKDIVVKTLISSEASINSMIKSNVRSRYIVHELFGFDILLDDQMRPWILEVNISPSLHSNSQLDIAIKGPMIRDMLNLAGFRIPDKADITTCAHASSSLLDISSSPNAPTTEYCMDKRLFTNQLAPDERAKHAFFCNRHMDDQVVQNVLNILTPDDIRVLIESIDEDSRKGGFIRVFPTPSTHHYLRFFEQPRYYNLLLDQWVKRYNHMEKRGISMLKLFCEEGVHLDNPTSNTRHQWFPPNSCLLPNRDRITGAPTKKEGPSPVQSSSRLPKVKSSTCVSSSLSSTSQTPASSSLTSGPPSPNVGPEQSR